jgi:hypothetical protein
MLMFMIILVLGIIPCCCCQFRPPEPAVHGHRKVHMTALGKWRYTKQGNMPGSKQSCMVMSDMVSYVVLNSFRCWCLGCDSKVRTNKHQSCSYPGLPASHTKGPHQDFTTL